MGAQPLITLGPWAVYTGLVLAALALPALLLWLIGDRARGRKRCGGCWYDMSATTGLKCPECGREHRHDRHLLRTRRRVWCCVAGGLLLPMGAGLAAGGYFAQSHRLKQLPLWAQVELMRWHQVLGPESMVVLDKAIERTSQKDLSERQIAALIVWWSEAPSSFENSTALWLSKMVSQADEGPLLVWEGVYSDRATAAVRRIGRTNPQAVERIIRIFQSAPNPGEALAILQCMSSASPRACRAIAQALQSDSDPCRQSACTAVRAAGPDCLMPYLSGSLMAETREDVWDAFRTCRNQAYILGTADKFDTPQVRRAILQAVADRSAWTFALRTLQDHPPPPGEIAAGLEWLLLAGESDSPSGAFTDLDGRVVDIIAAAGPVAIGGAASACSDPRSHVRYRVASVLKELAQRSEKQADLQLTEHLPALVGATADAESSVRWAALCAARAIMARDDSRAELADTSLRLAIAQAAVVAIDTMASRRECGSLRDLAGLVSRLGTEAGLVRARLNELAESDDPRIRGSARQAIQLIGND